MNQTNPPTRRSFLVTLGGALLGNFALPSIFGEHAELAGETIATNSEPLVFRALRLNGCSAPILQNDGTTLMVFETDKGERFVWRSRDAEEIDEVLRLHASSHCPGKPEVAIDSVFPINRSREEWRLIREIIRKPGNMMARYAYADWQIAQGNPIGELRRLDCELHDNPQGSPEIVERLVEIDTNQTREWMLPFAALGIWPSYLAEGGEIEYAPRLWMRRGMIEHIDVYCNDLLPENAELLFQAAPALRSIMFCRRNWDIPKICNLPQFKQITALEFEEFFDNRLSADDIQAMVNSPNLSRLQSLKLDLRVFYNSYEQRFEYDHKDERKFLDLLAPLCDSRLLSQLQTLHISGAELADRTVAQLVMSPQIKHLRDLRISGNLNPEGIRLIFASPYLKNLKSLDLSGNCLHHAGMETICQEREMKLHTLKLANCMLDDESLKMFSQWQGLSSINVLDLSKTNAKVDFSMRSKTSEGDEPIESDRQEYEFSDLGATRFFSSPLIDNLCQISWDASAELNREKIKNLRDVYRKESEE